MADSKPVHSTAKHHDSHKAQRERRTRQRRRVVFGLGAVLIIGLVAWLVDGGASALHRTYLKQQIRQRTNHQNALLGDPFTTFGFGQLSSQTECDTQNQQHTLSCTTTRKGYRSYNSDEDKQIAIGAAQKLQNDLASNGWHHGDYLVGDWYKNVLHGRDWNPDAYQYKQLGNTFCVFDFYVAYSNPKPPAVSVLLTCTAPDYGPQTP